MPAEPLVYIIVVNWNGKNHTLTCLQSLGALSYRNYRIVVVDNASSDGSVEVIHATFPAVTVLEMERNLRFAGGTNAGLRYALEHGAEQLLILNNDTTVGENFLTAMVARVLLDERIGMVAPKIYYYDDPERIWFAGGHLSMWTGTMRHIGLRERDSGKYDDAREIEYASGCCILTRRAVVETIGLLDESYFMYTEDADWCMRARRAGYRIMYEPRATIWHKLSVSAGGHLSWYKMRNKFLSNLRFFGRYAAWYQWLVFPWLNVLVNGYVALRYVLDTRFRRSV
jgi:GT2 family glycosyltransferase